jgi:hypothetical protein
MPDDRTYGFSVDDASALLQTIGGAESVQPEVSPRGAQTQWAINIGSLAPASHPLTGHTTGVAAVLRVKDDGDLEITDDRRSFVRRDAAGTLDDGTLIQLASVSGRLTVVWADCGPHESLTDLPLDPNEEE